MNLFLDAIAWILDPAQRGANDDLLARIGQQLAYTFGATLIAGVIAVPVGYLIGHSGRGRELAVSITGGLRALPSLGVLLLLGLAIGIGFRAPLITFVILAVPPLLAGAYSGVQAVGATVTDAARAVGMTEWQVLVRVEAPLGLPLLIGGVRAALLQVVATATLAAYVNGGALGSYIFAGLATRNYSEMLGASIVITALALLLEGAFALVQRLVVPRGVVAGAPKTRTRTPRVAVAPPT